MTQGLPGRRCPHRLRLLSSPRASIWAVWPHAPTARDRVEWERDTGGSAHGKLAQGASKVGRENRSVQASGPPVVHHEQASRLDRSNGADRSCRRPIRDMTMTEHPRDLTVYWLPRTRGRRRRDPDRRPGAGGMGVRRGRAQEPQPRAHGHESRGDGPRLRAGRRVPVGTGVGGRDAPATRRRDRVRGRRAADRPGAGGGLPGRLGRGARSAALPRGAGSGGRAGRPAQPDVAEHGRGVRARRAGIDRCSTCGPVAAASGPPSSSPWRRA